MFGSPLYLDISETRVRIIKGSAVRDGMRISGYADMPWLYSLGDSLDNDRNREIGSHLHSFLTAEKLKSRRASVVISRDGIITRTTRVPALEKKLLHEFVHAAINEFLPVDLNEYAFDYRVMRSTDGGDGTGFFDLLLGAIPRYMVEQVMQIMDATGMRIDSIDILPNALLRLFSSLPYNDVAVLSVNRDGSRIAILEDRNLLLYADIPFYLWSEEEDWQDFSILMDEARGYLNFFAARHQGQPVEALYVVGDLATRPELVMNTLGGTLGVPVKVDFDDVLVCRWPNQAEQPSGFLSAGMAGNLGMLLRKG